MDVIEQMLCTVNVPYAVPVTHEAILKMLTSGTVNASERHFAVSLFSDVPENVWKMYLNEERGKRNSRLDTALRLLNDCKASHFSRVALYLFLEKRKERSTMKETTPQFDRSGLSWRILLREALSILDMSPELGGRWTFGGGTVLSFMLSHRESHDIDIFVDDPQLLGYLSPKFSGEEDRYDETSNYIKIYRPEGEIDFILAPRLLLDVPLRRFKFEERSIPCEHPLEIVAKKLYYRGNSFAVRDWLDLAVVVERYELDALCGFCTPILKRSLELPNVDDILKLNLNADYRSVSKLNDMFQNLKYRLTLLNAEMARQVRSAVARDDEELLALNDQQEFLTI